MSSAATAETVAGILESVQDAILYEKDVNIIKDGILAYLDARRSVAGDSPEMFLESFKQLVQKMVQIQDSLEKDIKPPVEILLDRTENLADREQNSMQEVLDDKHLVQIHADRKEMYRRISSFVTRKRKEVDDWNVQEFCSHRAVDEENPLWEEINSCARVDAVFVPRTGSKSHVKVSKVNNLLGPQMQLKSTSPVSGRAEGAADSFQFESDSIEERILNMESHLKLKSASPVRSNIFARIKQLEDRILYLESSSPEYLSFLGIKAGSPEKQSKIEEPVFFTSSSSRLHKRMQTLREELKWRSRKMACESP